MTKIACPNKRCQRITGRSTAYYVYLLTPKSRRPYRETWCNICGYKGQRKYESR